MNYNTLNDYELVYYVNENNELAYNEIFDKYTPLVKKIAHDYYTSVKVFGIDYDDLCQEGFVAISKAVKEYDGKTSLFYTYVYICIRREIEKYIKSFRRLKHKYLNEAISLNEPAFNDEKDGVCFQDMISSFNNVETYIYSKYDYNTFYFHKYDFDFTTSCIYELKMNGFVNKEISSLLDITYRDICKKVVRIKNNLKEYIKKLE